MHEKLKPASLAGARLDKYFHTCAFVRSRDEECRTLGPFLAEGLAWGEKAVYIMDPAIREAHLARLAAAGVDAQKHPGQFDTLTWTDTYLRDGRFDQEFMLGALQETIRAGVEQGFPRLRIIGQMSWALEEGPDIDQVLGYEVRVNDVLARARHPAVCVYDLDKLTGTMMMDLLRVHPLTLVGGVIYENPFYTPAEQMLAKLRERGSAARGSA